MINNLKNTELISLLGENLSKDELLLRLDSLLTEQKWQSEFYKNEFERLNVIVDLIPNTISWVTKEMTYFGVNRALASTCNLEPKDFIGRKIGFHTRENFFYEFVTELFRSSNNTIYRELEAKISGVPHTYLVSGTKLSDKSKAVVIGVDITELSELKDQVSLTERLATLGEMFAGIIHDINNPLMAIEGNVKRIKKRTDDEEINSILDKVELSSKKISKIVQGIKVFIRQDADTPHNDELLGNIIDDAIIICENKFKQYNVIMRIDPKLYNLKINCNFTQIFQVFVNLFSNAVDAICGFPERWIELNLLKVENGLVYIQVVDSGNGIPKEMSAKIFNAFFTTKERGVGSGLGLSLCKKILESHKGNIVIDNECEHTSFVITLPVVF